MFQNVNEIHKHENNIAISFFVFLFRIDEDLKIVTMTKHIAMMNSMKQNSILLKGRFNHHESDQH